MQSELRLPSRDGEATGPFGPDRVARAVYDKASQVTNIKVAVGTPDEANERTLSYTDNGMLATLKDGENNLTTFEYDGHDRLSKTRFPLPTKGANASSTSDHEQLAYETTAGGTRTSGTVISRRLRDGTSLNFSYDALGRLTGIAPPNPDPTRIFAYDNIGRLTSATKFGVSLSFAYDALSRLLSETGPMGTTSSQWDVAGRRTRLTYPAGFFLTYDHLVTGETSAIRENGTTSLAAFTYDDLLRRTLLVRGNGRSTSYGYDPVSRLSSLTNSSSGSASNVTFEYGYNPAHQIVTRTASNDAYSWTGHGNGTTTYTTDGLNRIDTVSGVQAMHDARGNMTFDPANGRSYTYFPSDNQLWVVSSPWAGYGYDSLSRLVNINLGGTGTTFAYDGLDVLGEYDQAGALQKRYVFGPGIDEPLVEYDSSGNRRFLEADERGSIILVANNSGGTIATNRYGEYGKPQAGNVGRFQYTGQMWLPEAALYHYKFRALDPYSGRFPQSDPIGYVDSPNLYAYVLNDPVNFIDPLGLCVLNMPETCGGDLPPPGWDEPLPGDIVVIGQRICRGVSIDDMCLAGYSLASQIETSIAPNELIRGAGSGGTGSETDEQTDEKPEQCPVRRLSPKEKRDRLGRARKAGLITFLGSYIAVEYPMTIGAAKSATKGARFGFLLGRHASPPVLVISTITGGIAGAGVYFFGLGKCE